MTEKKDETKEPAAKKGDTSKPKTKKGVTNAKVTKIRLGNNVFIFSDPVAGVTITRGETAKVKKLTSTMKKHIREGGLEVIK